MLREIEWGVQSGSITMNGVLPVTTLSYAFYSCKVLQSLWEKIFAGVLFLGLQL